MKDWFSHLDFYKTRKCDLDLSRGSVDRVQRTKLPNRLNPRCFWRYFLKTPAAIFESRSKNRLALDPARHFTALLT
jgi:hypothetical protein